MLTSRILAAGMALLAVTSVALADFDGPAPLSWRWVEPTKARVRGTPLVDGDTVYVAVGQRAFALDKSTGNQKWRFPLVDPIDGYFFGTPLLIHGVLVVAADNHKVYGLDPATGQEKWTYTAHSGLLGGAVKVGKYVAVAESDDSIMAIDPATGQAVWTDDQTHQELPIKMLYGITGELVGNGDDILVTDNNNELVSISTVTKKPDWKATFTTLDETARPLVLGDLIVVNSGQYLTALRASTGRAAWQIPLGANLTVGPAVSGDGIFVVDEDGNANYYNLSGRKLTKNPIALGSYPATRPAVAGKYFVVPTTNGAINLVDPTTGEITWSYLVRPIGVVYANQGSTSSQTGPGRGNGPGSSGSGQSGNQNQEPDRIWTVTASGTPVVAGDTLLVLAQDGSLLAFDKTSGVDLTPPRVTMSYPRPGSQVNGDSLEVLFKIEDEASGVNDKSLKITVDGAPLNVKFGTDGIADVRFSMLSKNQPLTNGRKVFEVTVSDWLGNKATEDFVLTIDNTLPKSVRPASNQNDNNGRGRGPGGPGGFGGGGAGG